MERTDPPMVALGRAYGLSEIVETDDERLRRLAEKVEEGLGEHGPVTLTVDGWEGRVDGRPVEDPDGFVDEMVRDLAAAGVREVRFEAELGSGTILDFLGALRGGAGSGKPDATARELADGLDGLSVTPAEGRPSTPDPADEIASLFGDAGAGDAGDPVAGDEAKAGMEAPAAEEAGPADDDVPAADEAPAAEEAPPTDDVPAADEAPAAEEAPPTDDAPAADEAPAGERESGAPEEGRAEPDDRTEAAGERLSRLVDEYFEAGPGEREERATALRERAAELRSDGRNEAVAEAVMRVAASAREGTGDPEALELAREMTTIGVAAHVAVRLVGVREEEERARLIGAAGALGKPMAEAVSDALADTNDRAARRTYIDTLLALGEPGIREAEHMIDDRRWFVVRNGVAILGEVGGARAIEHLTSALGHDDPRVRREAVMALARIGGGDAGDLLVGMVDDPDPDVRAAVAMALGVLKVERAVKPLLKRLEQEDEEDVQVELIRALGALGDPGAVSAIEKRAVASFFSRPPVPLRIAAYKALSDIGTPHAMELLEDAVDDKDPEVRETVREIVRSRGD